MRFTCFLLFFICSLSSSVAFAQISAPSGMGATSPLGISPAGSSSTDTNKIPLGATELNVPGLSPMQAPCPNTGSNAAFDGGGDDDSRRLRLRRRNRFDHGLLHTEPVHTEIDARRFRPDPTSRLVRPAWRPPAKARTFRSRPRVSDLAHPYRLQCRARLPPPIQWELLPAAESQREQPIRKKSLILAVAS